MGNYPEPKEYYLFSKVHVGLQYPLIFISLPVSQRKTIFKITKTFNISAGYDRWSTMINPHAKLRNSTLIQNGLPGNGIRLRYKLPGTADKIVLEQYNIRSLVQSYQMDLAIIGRRKDLLVLDTMHLILIFSQMSQEGATQ